MARASLPDRLIRLGPIVALFIVATIGLLAYRRTTILMANFAHVRVSHQVSIDLVGLLSALSDAETGERGYIITGKSGYLAPYSSAQATISRTVVDLRVLTSGDPDLQRQLAQLEPLITAKQDELEQTITLRRTQGFAAAVQVVQTGRGKDTMEAIRAAVAAMRTTEGNREAAELAAVEAGARQAVLTTAIAGILTFCLIALADMAIIGELRRRSRAEADLARQFAEAEAARRELAAVLDATNEAIILLFPERRIGRVNRRFGELFGLSAVEVLGRSVDELQRRIERIFADPGAFCSVLADAALEDRPQFVGVLTQQWPEQRDLQLFSAPVPSGDRELLGRLFVFRDVTREREADRLKTEFVSLVSHELRTPLTSIKGYIDLLADGEVGPLSADQAEFLDIAKSNADRLVVLINDLLDLSRIEAGKVDLRRQPLALAPLLQQVTASMRPQLESKHQAVSLDVPVALPPVCGDPDRLVQVFTNLLSNATKYTPEHGAVRIQVRSGEEMVQVDVADTGVGMTTDELDQLFTKFFRSSNPLARDAGGTGLGLTITRSLVELHGGQIRVRSTPGNGSTFTVYLPAGDPSPADRQHAPKAVM